VDEFWVCQHCRSLNRAGTGRCYHCREKFGSRPKDAPQIVRQVATPAPPAFPPGAIGNTGSAGFGAPIGSGAGAAAPAYLSRPVALASAPARDFSAAAQAKPAREFRRPQLTGWIRRRVTMWLAVRPTVPVRFSGYVAAALLAFLLLVGALIITTVTPILRTALQTGSITSAWAQLDTGRQSSLESMTIAFAVIGALALLFFSLLIGLATHNAVALGAEMPFLTPYRAGTAWLAALWTQARIAICLIVPAILLWRGYPLPGLIAALIAVELAQRSLGDPLGWLTNPARHLPDLYAKLGVSGADHSLIGTVWAFFFRLVNVLAIVAYSIPLVAFGINTVATVSGHTELLTWPASGTGPYQLAITIVLALLILATSVAVGLLVPICIELVERQRTRKTLLRVGRSRSWVAPPGNMNASAPASGPTRYDSYASSDDEDPDQASLYSPSTTSSFPWEDEVSEEGPLV